MNNRLIKIVLSGIIFFLIMNFVSSASEVIISVEYDDSPGASYIDDTRVYQTDSIILRVYTNYMAECFYGESEFTLYGFEGEYGFVHDAYLENLEEGSHEYYIKCSGSSESAMEIRFATKVPIYATLVLSESPPLKEGKYKINLKTSKTSLETPRLEYTFDGIIYKEIYLRGGEDRWEGDLIVPASVGETVCSFKFKARDLTGGEGTKIIGDSSFIVDTVKPAVINTITATGYLGQIKLNWFSYENIKEFNIYRSESSPLDYTDFYKTSSKESFYDNDVEKGKTYYYRIAGVDEAGNIGDLSREVFATALLTNFSNANELNPSLIGKVDNQISEINLIINNARGISSSMESNNGKEKEIFKEIKLDKEIENSLAELNSLKRDVEGYKLQDLSLDGLNKKLDSAALRLNIIKKKIPENIIIKEEREVTRELGEGNIQRTILEYSSNLELDNKKKISESLKTIKEKNVRIKGEVYIIEVLYLDGAKKILTLFREDISSDIGKDENLKLILVVPKSIAEKSSEMKIINLEYDVVKDDPVLAFNSDTKKIVYYLSKEISPSLLDDILIAPINVREVEEPSKITGKFILEFGQGGSTGIIVLSVLALILMVYFLKIKREPSLKHVLEIIEDIKRSKDLLKEGKEEEALKLYADAKRRYRLLDKKEKDAVMESIKSRG